MKIKPAPVIFLGIFLLAALIFVLKPGIDPAVTALFYDEQAGFVLDKDPVVRFSYRNNRYIVAAATLGIIVLLIITAIKKRAYLGYDRKALTFLLLVMLLGPGLVVNTVFKNQWGRARPHDTTLFGGTQQYTTAFVMTDQCERNCSFVSGHAAAIFFFTAFGLLATQRRRKWIIYAVATTAGALVGLGRVVQGDHFLSDIIFAFFFVFITAWSLHWIMYRWRQEKTTATSDNN